MKLRVGVTVWSLSLSVASGPATLARAQLAPPEAPAAPTAPEPPGSPEPPAASEGAPGPPFSFGGDDERSAEAPEPSGEVGLPPELSGRGREEDEALLVEEEGGSLTIEEIMNSLVVSASNRAESSLTAPAWVITLTGEELNARGYLSLDEYLDDLPGIDVSRPNGDVSFKDYWRGYRNEIGAPYLLLIDGVVFNHLWYENTQVMAAFPLSSIERVEVLFGPASAVYGPNAAMGVINVITKNDRREDGVSVTSRIGFASPQRSAFAARDLRKIGDMHALMKKDDLRLSLAARFDYGVFDPNVASDFEYTRERYYADRTLWGDFVDRPTLAGSFHSPSEKLALDARAYYGSTEAAAQYFRLLSGNGTVYAADRIQANAPITYTDSSFYLRHTEHFASATSSTMVRYRTSNVANPTTFLARFSDGTLFYAEDKSSNFSVTAQQDFRLSAAQNLLLSDDELLLDFGTKYEYKDLEQGFVETNVAFAGVDDVDLSLLPMPPVPGYNVGNRKPANNIGGYLLGKYKFLTYHWINLGMRADYRELVGRTSVAFRGGYIGNFFDSLTVKTLYGQATQEPTARELFAVVAGATANPNLREQRSQTLELNLNYVLQWFGALADVYWVNYKNPIIGAGKTFINVGKRDVVGLDAGLHVLPPLDFVRQLKLWAYYSTYLYAKESSFIAATASTPARSGPKIPIGDISGHKIKGGVTVDFTSRVGFTLLGRWFSERETVPSNPIGNVAGYLTLDANLLLEDLPLSGMMIDVRCTNLLDAQYSHPGIKAANSGDTPGEVVAGSWVGSRGDFNSLLPQPGRAFSVMLGMNL